MSPNPIERLFDALAKGDVKAAKDCFTADAQIWHNFDTVQQDVQTASQAWEMLVKHTKERHIEDVRVLKTAEGFVQQHVFVVRSAAGDRKAWPICVVVKTQGELISRFDEYMDRAGSFAPPEGKIATPGF